MGLQILAAVFAASRGLWPRCIEDRDMTVLVNVGQLRKHDIKAIMHCAADAERSLWVMMRKNDREASLDFLPAGDANQLNRRRQQYWVLDLRFDDNEILS